jgi:phage tail-like protein
MNQDGIKNLLPAMFRQASREGGPLSSIFGVMEALHEKTETTLSELDRVFAPLRTDDPFVPFLSKWVDLDWIIGDADGGPSPIDTACFRELIAIAWYLSQWRGTARGLLLFLETATGVQGFAVSENITDEKGHPLPFHIEIAVPKDAGGMIHLIERIVENEKPAYVTYSLKVMD